jgi:protoporphyrinogen oxidase
LLEHESEAGSLPHTANRATLEGERAEEPQPAPAKLSVSKAVQIQPPEAPPTQPEPILVELEHAEGSISQLTAEQVVLACDAQQTNVLLGQSPPQQRFNAACTLYFSAPYLPWAEGALYLNAQQQGLINLVCFPSAVQASYAPAGKTLVCVSLSEVPKALLGQGATKPSGSELNRLSTDILEELVQWFGPEAKQWAFLKGFVIPNALPASTLLYGEQAMALQQWQASVQRPGLTLAGDYLDTASINGAIRSGRLAAQTVLAALEASAALASKGPSSAPEAPPTGQAVGV